MIGMMWRCWVISSWSALIWGGQGKKTSLMGRCHRVLQKLSIGSSVEMKRWGKGRWTNKSIDCSIQNSSR
jgi:hypothetical protein